MNELTPYTIKDTGVTILIKHVSPLLVMELRRQFPPPKPPMQTVDLGGETKEEPNYAHPDYLQSITDYNKEMENRIRRLLLKRGVVIPEDYTTWKTEIEELRQFWKDEYKKELPRLDDNDNRVDWIGYIACGTEDDFEELYEHILRRSMPTPEAVEAAKDGFPGEVSGP